MIRELLIAFTVAATVVVGVYYTGFGIAVVAGTVIEP